MMVQKAMGVFRWSSVVATLTMLGALIWSGCGSSDDRYYCDDHGCYTCDGYGCTTATPPAPPACTGNASCASGSVCTSSGCAKSCQTSDTCDKGTVCSSGLCVAPGQDAGTPKECTTKADCGGAGHLCIDSHCQACGGTSGPCSCTATSDCSDGDVCAGGVCTAPANVCHFASECPAGDSCVDGQCVKACTDVSQCSQGEACTKGVCQPDPGKAQCTGDAQCSGSTPKCVDGSCAAACTSDAQCGDGKYCNHGACVIDTRPKPICTDTDKSACGATQQCVDGFCKYPCQSDANCKVIDARIGYCGIDHVCRTQAEAHPQCTKPEDCTGGLQCIDNACK